MSDLRAAATTKPRSWRLIASTTSSAQQRDEAVQQVHRDAALLQQADQPREVRSTSAAIGQVEPVPEVVLDRRRDSAAARRTGVGSSRSMRKNGSKIWRIGWPKPSAVSCMRGVLPREAAVPGRRAAHAAVVEPAHQQEGQRDSTPTMPSRKITRAVARPLDGDRRQQPAAGGHACRRGRADELPRRPDRSAAMTLRPAAGRAATQPAREPQHARRAPSGPASCACGELLLARLAEEDHAEELDHRVAGQRGDQRDQRGRRPGSACSANGSGSPGVNRKLCSSSHSETKPFERRQAGARERADQREPGDPRHVADQPAELAQAALAGRMQHRAGAEEEQALEERVAERRGTAPRSARAPPAASCRRP